MMQLFRRSLLNWLPYIKKTLKADDAFVELRAQGLILDVVVVRKGSSHTVTLTREKILGDNARMPLRDQRLVQPVCRFVDDIVMELRNG